MAIMGEMFTSFIVKDSSWAIIAFTGNQAGEISFMVYSVSNIQH